LFCLLETELNEIQYHIIRILLKSLINIDNSLPSVNWNPLLSQLTLMNINSNDIKILCLKFALKHVYLNHKLSKSILFYLLNSISFLFSESNIQHHKDLLIWFISEEGLGNQLSLAGLPPFNQIEEGISVNVNDVVISYTKMAEIVQVLINSISICENTQKVSSEKKKKKVLITLILILILLILLLLLLLLLLIIIIIINNNCNNNNNIIIIIIIIVIILLYISKKIFII